MKSYLLLSILFAMNVLGIMAQNTVYLADLNEDKILKIDLNTSIVEEVITGINELKNIALSKIQAQLFWGTQNGRIYSSDLDGNNTTLIAEGIGEITDILIDEENKNLYWSEFTTGRIMKTNFDGTSITVFLSGLAAPGFLAIDNTQGQIYWSEWNSNSIKRADLSGQNMETFILGYDIINGLYFNQTTKQLFWTDWSTHTLYRTESNGTNTTEIITGIGSTIDVYVDELNKEIYWLDNFSFSNPLKKSDLNGEFQEDVISFDSFVTFGGFDCNISLINASKETPISLLKIVLFPNPTTESVTISWLDKQYTNVQFNLYGLNGKLIHTAEVSNQEQINLVNMNPGMYFYKLSIEGVTVSTGKVVKE